MQSNFTPFDEVYTMLSEYVSQHKHCKVPVNYVAPNGFKLGGMVHSIRTGNRKLSAEERKMLNELGFVWRVNQILSFDEVLEQLTKYVKKNGHCNVPANHVTDEGVNLGHIVQAIRRGDRKLSDEEKNELNKLGFVWNVATPFSVVIDLLVEYEEEHGHCKVPFTYVKNGIKLGQIIHNIKNGMRKVNAEERLLLDLIGFEWKAKQ